MRIRHGELDAMVLAEPEVVDAGLIGEHAFGDDVADDLVLRRAPAGAVARHRAPKVSMPKVTPSNWSTGGYSAECGRRIPR